MKTKDKTNYLENCGSHCPKCHKYEMVRHFNSMMLNEWSTRMVSVKCVCVCGQEWFEYYRLVNVELEELDEDMDFDYYRYHFMWNS